MLSNSINVNYRSFVYTTGEIIQLGDTIKTGNNNMGKIKKIIFPNTQEADDYSCPKGGVLIEENWNNQPSFLLLGLPSGKNWEDLQLIKHQTKQETGE